MATMKKISKDFKNQKILNNITITLKKGKIIGLTGRNGCGKTTLLKSLIGLTQTNIKNHIESFSYLDSEAELFDFKLSGIIDFYKNVYNDFDISKFNILFSSIGIDKETCPSKLSFGERKKLKLALILSKNVEFYILDEPFTGVDIFSLNEMITLIIEAVDLTKSGVVIADHNIEFLERISDHIIIMKNGTIKSFDQKNSNNASEYKNLLDIYSEVEGVIYEENLC